MKFLILCVLAIVCACAFPKYAEPGTINIYAEVDASAAVRVLCSEPSSGRRSVASASRVGDAVVTAKHVVAACGGLLDHVWSSAEGHDVAVLSYGDPGPCIDAAPGEPLVFLGYPGTDVFGAAIRAEEDLVMESDVGLAENVGLNVMALSATFPYAHLIRGMSGAQTNRVRPGYSGGPVFSAKDGRIVGITNASTTDGATAYFTPISTVCKMIRKEAPYE
jgi:hypothetical protein